MNRQWPQAVQQSIDRLRSAENAYITFRDGRRVSGRVVITFDNEDTGRLYILFTDDSKNPQGQYRTFAATFDPMFNGLQLDQSLNNLELDMINNVIKAHLSKGFLHRTPICKLYLGDVIEVHFN